MEYTKTTFTLPQELLDQLKIMCVLTHKNQSEFIRIAIKDKIKDLKVNKVVIIKGL